MAFETEASRDNELSSANRTGERDNILGGNVGKQTLTENLPASRLAAVSPSLSRTRGSLLSTPDTEERISFAVSLPEGLREQIRQIYDHYVTTGQVKPLADIIQQVLVLAVGTVAPKLSEAEILRDIQQGARSLSVDGDKTDARLLAWFVGLAELPKKTGRKLPKRAAVSSVDITFSVDDVKRLRGPEDQMPPIEEVSTLSGILDWGWGVVMGDFNEEASAAQIAVNALLGLIPVVDQILDVRDIVANLYFLIGQQRYNEFAPWFGLVITVIGCIPEVGSPIKGIVKILRNVARRIPIGEALTAAKLGAKALQPALEAMLRGIANVGSKVAAKARTLFNYTIDKLVLLRDTVGKLKESWGKYLGELVERAKAALGRLQEKVREAMAEVESRLRSLVDDLTSPAKQADTPTLPKTKIDEPTLPKTKVDEPTLPKSKPNESTLPLPNKRAADEPTLPKKSSPDAPTSKTESKDWWQRRQPLKPDLDPTKFRELPTPFAGGAGSMSDVYRHKTIKYPNGVEIPRWAMKVIGKNTDYDVLSPEVAAKLFSRVANMFETATQVLGKGAVPNTRAFAPVQGVDGVKFRPALVQEYVDGVPLMSFGGVRQTNFQAQATQWMNSLSQAMNLPILQKHLGDLDTWTIDANPANFIVANVRDKNGKVVDHVLKWIDPFFPPAVDKILANPKLLD